MKKSILLVAALAVTFASCGDKKNSAPEAVVETTTEQSHHDHHAAPNTDDDNPTVQFSEASKPILDGYFAMKKSLQEDQQADATAFIASLSTLDTYKDNKDVLELQSDLKKHAEAITNADIKTQRKHFEELSDDLLDLVEIIGSDRELYEHYCPMYDNDKGGMWISETKELINPLFGSEMLTCGIVKGKISIAQ